MNAFRNKKRAPKALAALDPQLDALIALYHQGQLAAVAERAQALVAEYPSSFVLWNILGVAHKGLGRLPEAEQGFRKAAELNSNYPDAHYNLGVTLQEQGKHDAAIAAYNRALVITPDHANAHNNLGVTLRNRAGTTRRSLLTTAPSRSSRTMPMPITILASRCKNRASTRRHRCLQPRPRDHAGPCRCALQLGQRT